MAVLDIIINTAAHAAARPLLAQKGGTRPGSPPLMTAGDGWDGNVSLRLWFYNAESGAITSTNVRKAGVSLSLYAKQSRTEAAPYLFEVAGFSEFQDGEGNYGYEAPVNLNTVELLAAVASGSSADAWVDVVEDGDATTQFQVTIRPQVDSGGALPSPAEPPYPHHSQLATKADLDALRGGVPLTGWANSTAYPFGACTITGGIPTALEFAGVTGDFAYAELSLTDFAPDTLDISGTVSAGTVELTDLSLVFLDGAGAEVGTIGALTLGAAFSFASVVVPSGAVKVAVKALGTAATSALSAGFSALSVTAHTNLSVLTAEALDAILADKAQAESDAQTVAALVTPAQTIAQTIADLVAPAQADAAAAGTARDNAEAYASLAAERLQQILSEPLTAGIEGVVAAGTFTESITWLSEETVVSATNGGLSPHSSPFRGWGIKMNKQGVSFNALGIHGLGRNTPASDAEKWSTIRFEVRACSGGGNEGVGALIAYGDVAVNPESTVLGAMKAELVAAGTGLPVTLTDSDLTQPYFVGYRAINSSGGNAIAGIVNGVTTGFEGNSFYTTGDGSSWANFVSDAPIAITHWMLSGGARERTLNKLADAPLEETPDILLPDNLYAVVGREANVYFRNVFAPFDGESLPDVTCSVGTQQDERWTLVPAAAATTTFTLTASGRRTGALKATAAASLKIAAANAAFTRKALFIGDSTTAAGTYTGELVTLDTADADTALTLIGTQGVGANKHEGQGGWTVARYYAPGATYYASNPFCNPPTAAGVFDFGYYLTSTGQTMASGDWVFIHLGINDCFGSTTDASAQVIADTAMTQLEAMIISIKAAVSGIRIGIMVTIPPSAEQNAFGANYNSGQTRWRYLRNLAIWTRKVINRFKGRTAANIWLVPVNTALDTVQNMERAAAGNVNSRNSSVQVARQSNGVHPAASGYYQMADAIWAFLKNNA